SMYYVLMEAGCLAYAWFYLTGALNRGADREAYERFFDEFIGISAEGSVLKVGQGQLVLFVVLTLLANFVVVYRGLARGIEEFCKWAMPIMALCAVCVLVRVLTLGTPDPTKAEQNL